MRNRSRTVRAVIDRAIAGIDQSLAIVAALLRIAEIEHTGGSPASATSRSPTSFARSATYTSRSPRRGGRVRRGQRRAPIVQGDRDLLLEAIANLVDNAVKFTPAGGRVRLPRCAARREAIVRVSDTGPGIARRSASSCAGASTAPTAAAAAGRRPRAQPGGRDRQAARLQLSISTGPGCVTKITGRRAIFSGPAKR